MWVIMIHSCFHLFQVKKLSMGVSHWRWMYVLTSLCLCLIGCALLHDLQTHWQASWEQSASYYSSAVIPAPSNRACFPDLSPWPWERSEVTVYFPYMSLMVCSLFLRRPIFHIQLSVFVVSYVTYLSLYFVSNM